MNVLKYVYNIDYEV